MHAWVLGLDGGRALGNGIICASLVGSKDVILTFQVGVASDVGNIGGKFVFLLKLGCGD